MKNILLKSNVVLFCAVFVFSSLSVLQAQSLSEKLGGVTTEFLFFTKDSTMNVQQQTIIKRSVAEQRIGKGNSYNDVGICVGSYDFVYEVVSEVFYLEFITKNPIRYIRNVFPAKRKKREVYYLVQFYNNKMEMISEEKMAVDKIQKILNNGKDKKYTYSINLKDIPILLLDQTKTINVVYYEILHKTHF